MAQFTFILYENVFDEVLRVWLTQGIGLHAHDDHSDHDVYHGDGTIVIKPYVWKMLCATFTIYFFFILQSILEYISLTYKQRQTASKVTITPVGLYHEWHLAV